jgi:hypothetical protein
MFALPKLCTTSAFWREASAAVWLNVCNWAWFKDREICFLEELV